MHGDDRAGYPGSGGRPGGEDAHPTEPIPRVTGSPTPPAAAPGTGPPGDVAELTQPIPTVGQGPGNVRAEQHTEVIPSVDDRAEHVTLDSRSELPGQADPPERDGTSEPRQSGGGKSLLKASGSMAVATLISRITGFGWKLVLAYTIGFSVANDSFTVANTLPTSIFELLIGGVLTSVIVPVLVRAQKSDPDGGQAYVRKLLAASGLVLALGTLLSLLAAPGLVWLYMGDSDKANPELATAFAYLLLPQILCYGASALFGALLQSKQIFGPPAWAPVMNNVVILATLGVYTLLPGELTVNPVRMTDAHLLTLGIGVSCGVLAQACVQIPALRRTGLSFLPRLGWDSRLSEFGGMTLWMLGYVGVSQIGLLALSRVATAADPGAWSIYNYVWMLLQLPYGVIGFSVMTAILPRMSAAAADGDHERMIGDLSLGNRLSTVSLLPISAVMTALGVPIAMALFSIKDGIGSVEQLGVALAISSFGVLPFAITMMQMRAFYSLKDARTPTLIMVVMTVAKVLLAMAVANTLPAESVVLGITFTNSFTFVIGSFVGELWLRSRLGPLGSRRFLSTLARTLAASVAGGAFAWLVSVGIDTAIPAAGAVIGWLQVVFGGTIGLAATFGVMWLLRVEELRPAFNRITGLLRRR
ncbi:putative peptidoglycan lipid II flippase [Actinopolyspora xinjiangensis]|uniref:Putative peptidoglycan lipid II flippase n=1 Tax=Actinopolyspora xinjiangensis TaxID=405564 RepID=A0A1H0VBH1_9ACTN|nr:murein biosynthesis integral membrane protein MurJ [Actinopolyspora xinjiangensis]SDP75701.1 putative peptidoglycan lipid II flippase [Actinopolyspora xinjiangensis]